MDRPDLSKTQSQTTRTRLLKLKGINPERSHVVENGLNFPYEPVPLTTAWEKLSAYGLNRETRFILNVGGNQWYKNRCGVVQIFKSLREKSGSDNLKLVLAGKKPDDKLAQEIDSSGFVNDIHILIDVENDVLMSLYSAAEALVFPSYFEGFGWPIAEAQACGCPVFTTNDGPMTEVGSDAAIYFNPHDIDEAADIILAGLQDHKEMKARGIENAKRFAPEVMANNYIGHYQGLRENASR